MKSIMRLLAVAAFLACGASAFAATTNQTQDDCAITKDGFLPCAQGVAQTQDATQTQKVFQSMSFQHRPGGPGHGPGHYPGPGRYPHPGPGRHYPGPGPGRHYPGPGRHYPYPRPVPYPYPAPYPGPYGAAPYCYTPSGSCLMNVPVASGTPCTCQFGYYYDNGVAGY